MNQSRAWIVEEFVPEGPERPRFLKPGRTRSRFSEWKEKQQRKNKDIRPEHWCIIRVSREDWEDVRRRDRMVLPEAMDAIRELHQRHPRVTLRLRNIKTNDTIMGAVLCTDLAVVNRPQGVDAAAGMQGPTYISGITGS